MAGKSKRKVPPKDRVDETILRDMVEVDTVQALLESFGQVCGVGAGIFTPDGVRIGEPAHHGPFCALLYKTEKGRAACARCDRGKIREIIQRGKRTPMKPYECHAGLIDFCVPILSNVGGKRRVIGAFFAGQIRYEEDETTKDRVRDIRDFAKDCELDPDELLSVHAQVPRLPRKRVNEIRQWMRQFANLIGLLVERKAATQQLLLDVIHSADDPNRIVKAIQQHLRPAAVSIFLSRDEVPRRFRNRVFLAATTFKDLASRLPVEDDLERISYRPDEGFTGWVYQTGRVLHIRDVRARSTYPQYPYSPKWKHKVKEIPDARKTQAFLGAPIRSDDGNTVGVIRAVRLKGDRGFNNDEIALLTGIASLVGAAASKATLYKEHTEKIEALNQAQGLLEKLTESATSLDSITRNMVEQLGRTYVKKGKWEGVYVLQHLRSSKKFRFVAAFPANLRKEFRGEPFADTEGVAGHILHSTGKTFASTNCAKDGVKPTTPWVSVVCAPIFREDKMWGAVSLCCERELLQTDVDLATPRITQFANQISLVCRLSEMLDARNAAALVASNVMSLNLEAHEVYKSLESSKITVDHLGPLVTSEGSKVIEALAQQIDDSLSWANVCLDLGRYIRLCQMEATTAIETFRNRHIACPKMGKISDTLESPWQAVDIRRVGRKALNSVHDLIGTLKTDMTARFTGGGIIVGDENLLYRALRNLLENAIVHGSRRPGGAGRFKKRLRVFLSMIRSSNTGMTKIVIRDEGEGMNPKILAGSQEIYADPTLLRSTSVSPGFGTTIVAFAVAVHLGSITVHSELGKGAQVCIQLPSSKDTRRMR